jgi:AcrR family transcriptional regulator
VNIVATVQNNDTDDAVSESLLAAATEIVARAGFEALRMRDVAKKAGVALGTPSYKFKNREGLLHAALERSNRLISENLKEYYEKGLPLPAYDAGLHFIWGRVQFAWDHPHETLLQAHAVYSNTSQNFREIIGRYADANVERIVHVVDRLEEAKLISIPEQRHRVYFARNYMYIGWSYTQSTALSQIDNDDITYESVKLSVACSYESLLIGAGNPAKLEERVKMKAKIFLDENSEIPRK